MSIEYPKSPVPADDKLWDCEKPFTAFGQFGEDKLDLRVFEQDVYWVNKFGEPFLLTEMTQDYLRNVMIHMFNHIEGYHQGIVLKSRIDLLLDNMVGDICQEEFSIEWGNDVATLSPAQWLASTPLVRKINSLLED